MLRSIIWRPQMKSLVSLIFDGFVSKNGNPRSKNSWNLMKRAWKRKIPFKINPQTDVNPSLVKAKYPWENPFSQKNVIFISVKVCYIFIFSKNFHFQKSCTHSALKGRKIWFDFVNHKMEKIYGRWVHFIKIKEY